MGSQWNKSCSQAGMIARTGSLLLAIATNLFLAGLFYSALMFGVRTDDLPQGAEGL